MYEYILSLLHGLNKEMTRVHGEVLKLSYIYVYIYITIEKNKDFYGLPHMCTQFVCLLLTRFYRIYIGCYPMALINSHSIDWTPN